MTMQTRGVLVQYICINHWAVVIELSTRVYIGYVIARHSQLNICIHRACCDHGKRLTRGPCDIEMIFGTLCVSTDYVIGINVFVFRPQRIYLIIVATIPPDRALGFTRARATIATLPVPGARELSAILNQESIDNAAI